MGDSASGGGGGSVNFSDFSNAVSSGFGLLPQASSATTNGTSSVTGVGTLTRQLQLDQEAITKMINDLLSGDQGLADIFSKENVSGLYNTEGAKKAAGDLVSQIVGELAKLTAKEETVQTQDQTTKSTSTQEAESGGLIKNLMSIF